MTKAQGHGQSECFKCKKEGKYSLTWTSFLYKIKDDEHLYCYECATELEGEKMKLEDAIKIIEHYHKHIEIGMPGYAIAIETILKELENSISKDKIKDEIKEIETRINQIKKDSNKCVDRVEMRIMSDEIFTLKRIKEKFEKLLKGDD